jgi:putative ABC transport system permease protein
MAMWPDRWRETVGEPARLAMESIRAHTARTALAVSGIIIGIVTVVLVASTLANIRNQVALLFRDLGTDNVFAFHLTGDPYVVPSEKEARRKPLKAAWAQDLARLGTAVRDVGVQVIVPTTKDAQVLTARSGGAESDTVLVEATSSNYFDIVGAEFSAGRPFTDLENRSGARVAVVGANLARALYGPRPAVGRTLVMGGDTYTVVGELEKRRGGFFGENRQDNVLGITERWAQARFGDPDRVVLYVRAKAGMRDVAYRETESILRRLRKLPVEADNDFALSTAEQIIATVDQLGRQIGLVTIGLAAVSLLIGAIGIANVMFISVTERTREIGLRMAVGARPSIVLRQFLVEAIVLSGIGGALGIAAALLLGFLITLVVTTFSAMAPLWAIAAGFIASLSVGVAAGYWPARRASRLNPVEALRYE